MPGEATSWLICGFSRKGNRRVTCAGSVSVVHERPVLGQVVRSKAGRDQGRAFLVVGVIGESYAVLTDGDMRPVANPKKKNIRHLILTGTVYEDLARHVAAGKELTNEQVREILAAFLRE